MENLLDVKQLSKRLNVSKWTIYELVAAQEIPFYRVQKKYVFSQEKVIKWLETRRDLGYGKRLTFQQVDEVEKAPYPPRKPFGYN